jgi:hypothetical protein
MFEFLLQVKGTHDIKLIAIEKQWAQKNDSKQSATTFQQHYGTWKCILMLARVPWVEVLPSEWLWPVSKACIKQGIKLVGGRKKNKPSIGYVANKYPGSEIKGPRGGYKDGRTDAVCIAEWAKADWDNKIKKGGV